MLAAGRHQDVVGAALVQAREQPWRESRWATLALAHYRCGRQADALASIRTARRMLGQQLGLDPGSELAGLERAILEQAPTLAADHEVRAAAEACPWRGLASYDPQDVDTFFGREEDVTAAAGPAARRPPPRSRRPVRERQVLADEGRAGPCAAPPGPPVRRVHAGGGPDRGDRGRPGAADPRRGAVRRPGRGRAQERSRRGRAAVAADAHRPRGEPGSGGAHRAGRPPAGPGRGPGLRPAGRARPLPRLAPVARPVAPGRRGARARGRPPARARPGRPDAPRR